MDENKAKALAVALARLLPYQVATMLWIAINVGLALN